MSQQIWDFQPNRNIEYCNKCAKMNVDVMKVLLIGFQKQQQKIREWKKNIKKPFRNFFNIFLP